MTLDELIAELNAMRVAFGQGDLPVVVITRAGAIKKLSGAVVFDSLVDGFAIKTVN